MEGDQGLDVTMLQYMLVMCGSGIIPDGVFGPKTFAAVKAFQDAHGLAQDGVFGPETWAALAKTITHPSGGQVVAKIVGSLDGSWKFWFWITAQDKGIQVALDTGAFELMLDKATAGELSLPDLGAVQVGGVGGSTQAENSLLTFQLGGVQFSATPCVVDEGMDLTMNLFGLRWFVENGYSLWLDIPSQTLYIMKGGGAPA